jgi:hypothetical protein
LLVSSLLFFLKLLLQLLDILVSKHFVILKFVQGLVELLHQRLVGLILILKFIYFIFFLLYNLVEFGFLRLQRRLELHHLPLLLGLLGLELVPFLLVDFGLNSLDLGLELMLLLLLHLHFDSLGHLVGNSLCDLRGDLVLNLLSHFVNDLSFHLVVQLSSYLFLNLISEFGPQLVFEVVHVMWGQEFILNLHVMLLWFYINLSVLVILHHVVRRCRRMVHMLRSVHHFYG